MPGQAPPPLPPDADLRRMVHFSASDGRIWLAGQRMLLVHAAAFGALRRELMGTIGREQTRRLLMRAGYASGERDAALARQVRGDASVLDMFAVGPQLHMLEGAVQVTPEECVIDMPAGRFHGRFRWDHSWEVETHVRDFGPQDEPVCWMLLGYASGYTSAFMGRPTLFKEVACAACGQPHCRIEGRVLSEWPDADALARDYAADSLIVRLEDLQSQVDTLRSTLQPADELGPLIGRSKAFDAAARLLRKAASTQVTVLLTGETGVGKERFARALHAMSPRAGKPFVAVNCAALPAELIESELFGAEKGAFTGAGSARPGRFERADGGTLLLDELGELPLTAQAKLLRVLQQGEIERLGGTQVRKVDVRVVAATNVDLQAAVASGRFRSDLMYRLNVYPIRIPPLRERVDDIEPLAAHLLTRFCALHGKRVPGFTDRALDAMRGYPWPGNVRELENLIERGVILASPDEPVDVHELFPTLPGQPSVTVNAAGQLERGAPSGGPALYDELVARGLSLDGLEDALIQEAVHRAGGNLAAAARALGLTRPQLSYRLQRVRERAKD
ncbi:sigma-54-dependent Fis family transcriptional regulator [uncultured Piscinibacter sp.]|uniref:sigma-54-dependent Fis family transcriptional regulator n=1 Tax=uncultured Piscinibacter sp. TaxID=1131835 RepID=UPI0026187CB5|nr:sigma-54-dependent Fis family transcriptional regulator [uncultured Piscinibacter sp.]